MAKLIRLLLVISVSIGTVASEKGACCPEGQYVLHKDRSAVSCFDTKTNITTKLPIICVNTSKIYPTAEVDFQVNDNGTLLIYLQSEEEIPYEPGTFCLFNRSRRASSGVRYYQRVAIICTDQDIQDVKSEAILGYCMIVSVIFLLGTACIYIALPELRDLQGKSIVNFCLSLGAGLGSLAAMKIIEEYSDMKLCAARGFFTYYFLIVAFFWSNAISLQILQSTRSIGLLFTLVISYGTHHVHADNIRQQTQCKFGWKEFAWYAIYAWGCPSIITIAMATVNFMPGKHRKPGIGLNHCWFYDTKLQWEYMYSVITILILINICIFIYTSFILWRYSFKASSHLKAVRYKFVMTMRLCVVMGIPWVFEMIGSLTSPNVIWKIIDAINSLQGLWIFLVLVVFRRRVIRLMHEHRWLECLPGSVERWLAVPTSEDGIQRTTGVAMDETKCVSST